MFKQVTTTSPLYAWFQLIATQTVVHICTCSFYWFLQYCMTQAHCWGCVILKTCHCICHCQVLIMTKAVWAWLVQPVDCSYTGMRSCSSFVSITLWQLASWWLLSACFTEIFGTYCYILTLNQVTFVFSKIDMLPKKKSFATDAKWQTIISTWMWGDVIVFWWTVTVNEYYTTPQAFVYNWVKMKMTIYIMNSIICKCKLSYESRKKYINVSCMQFYWSAVAFRCTSTD